MISIQTKQISKFNNMILVEMPQGCTVDLPQAPLIGDNCYRVDIYTPDEKAPKKEPKRSRNANNYMWAICQRIAEALSMRGHSFTKVDIYRKNICEAFEPDMRDHHDTSLVKEIKIGWESGHIGWVCEIAEPAAIYGRTWLNFWRGSSTFSVKKMSRLIECVKQDAYNTEVDISDLENHYERDGLDKLIDDWAKMLERKQNG